MKRMPCQAGSFYEAEPGSCRRAAKETIDAAALPADLPDELFGGVVPHAGWVFSGRTAALTLKAYQNKKGEYPQSLAQLPETIEWANLPEDPFSGEDFIYRREGEGFLIYSIGANLKDDGGKVEQDWKEGDIVWRCER